MRIAGTEITFTFHYVSINTVGGTGGEGGADIFTFHYVSINTKLASIHSHNMRTLHSTMFLLIHGVDSTQAMAGLKTLHSTMFLLILLPCLKRLYSIQALHSTMFLLIQATTGGCELSEHPLHSTMFLLIPAATEEAISISNLYIPLCFY